MRVPARGLAFEIQCGLHTTRGDVRGTDAFSRLAPSGEKWAWPLAGLGFWGCWPLGFRRSRAAAGAADWPDFGHLPPERRPVFLISALFSKALLRMTAASPPFVCRTPSERAGHSLHWPRDSEWLRSPNAAFRMKRCAGGKGEVETSSAGVAELVDALDLGSSGESRGGSNPSARTMRRLCGAA